MLSVPGEVLRISILVLLGGMFYKCLLIIIDCLGQFLYNLSDFLLFLLIDGRVFVFLSSSRYKWHIALCKFKVCKCDYLIHIYCDMITTLELVDTSITSHDYFFLLVIGTCETYSLTSLLTAVTMLYLGSLELIHLRTGSLYTLTSTSHFSRLPAPGNQHSAYKRSFEVLLCTCIFVYFFF